MTTTTEYYTKLICFLCSYGEKVMKYSTQLSVGNACDCSGEHLHTLGLLIDQYQNFDLREFPSFPGAYSVYTKQDFYNLINKIESLL